MPRRIYIVEEHPVMRQGYLALIEEEMDLEVCGESGSAREARQRIPELDPNLVIVDLSLQGGSGLELIKDLHARRPDLKILVISRHDETLYADRALQAGARGYLMKSEAGDKVVEAIRQVLGGNVYLSQEQNTQLLLRFAGSEQAKRRAPLAQLSDRELEVFEHMGRGLSTDEIAEKLALSPTTINSYRGRLKEKLSVDSTAELRRRAIVWVES